MTPCPQCGAMKDAQWKRCADCRYAAMQRTNKARRAAKPLQYEAQRLVQKAVRCGLFPPASYHACADCAAPAAAYDHRDYTRPLDVVPVCTSCNGKRGAAEPYRSQAA